MQANSTQNATFGLIGWLVLCFVTSAIGAAGSMQATDFYASLVLPEWAPPAGLFGPVWIVLFTLMGIAAWLVWRRGGFIRNGNALGMFIAQLAVNALWSWLFFAWHRGGWALADILLLWMFVLATSMDFWRADRLAGALLLPYLAWLSYAAALNFEVWQSNPALLG